MSRDAAGLGMLAVWAEGPLTLFESCCPAPLSLPGVSGAKPVSGMELRLHAHFAAKHHDFGAGGRQSRHTHPLLGLPSLAAKTAATEKAAFVCF